ncbi:hypothetical protein ELY33_17020 [Vreelandella andesensis]|uniref:Secreted protein n=1 Tax=Vreelandella andesensis TaxID=447567 RepID=A0A3S0VYT9_9GAMM|nr:hypothetical protein [Halomonas andesensis]RUR26809.1 hypothetical protein ELY33_17020 [Halomonas andesensis]
MTTRTLSLAALLVVTGSMVLAANLDAADERHLHRTYCADVAVWQAEAARGIDPLRRTGHPDYRGIAEEHCPGLRPAK